MAQFNKISQNKDSVTIPRKSVLSYAVDDEISKKGYRVLMFLLAYLNSDDYTPIDPTKVANRLFMDKKDAKKALAELEASNIIIQGSNGVNEGYTFLL